MYTLAKVENRTEAFQGQAARTSHSESASPKLESWSKSTNETPERIKIEIVHEQDYKPQVDQRRINKKAMLEKVSAKSIEDKDEDAHRRTQPYQGQALVIRGSLFVVIGKAKE